MRGIRVASIGFVILKVQLSLAQTAPLLDQTQPVQAMIDSLPPNGVLDCGNQHYVVTSLQLKSNMTIQNCQLETLPGAVDFTSPITIDGRSDAKSNIQIYNVHVSGNRHGQTDIGYAHEEDGGRHCFRLVGRASNVTIDSSSGKYCASDGISLLSYGVSTSDSPDQLPFQHITIRNSDFSFNRRQGASADGVSDLIFDKVTFVQNGTTLPGGAEGDQCASAQGNCYGTGFWYEDYRATPGGEGLSSIVISNCVFQGNFQRSVYFYTIASPSAPGYLPRTGVRIMNSYLDRGQQPFPEDYALQFQAEDSIAGLTSPFQDIVILNSVLDGSVGFRHAANIYFQQSRINTTLSHLGYSLYSTDISFINVQGGGKVLAATLDASGQGAPIVNYWSSQGQGAYATSPPQSGSNAPGDIVWNTQTNVSPTGWVCITGGTPCSLWQNF